MIDFKDKSQKAIGSLGVRWFFTYSYMALAIGIMVFSNIFKPIDIISQTIIHGILLFFLCLGLYFALTSSEKVQEAFIEESQIRGRVEDMKKATEEVQLKLGHMKDIPADIMTRITTLQQDLRFMSPCNNKEAYELETIFLNEMKAVQDCLNDIPLNYDKLLEFIQNCERTCKRKKLIYSI